MRYARVLLLAVALVCVLVPGTASAQTGCPADNSTAVVVNPTTVRAELLDHTATLLDGTPSVTGYSFGWYAEGASVPTSNTAMPKSAFTLVPGTTYCYDASLPSLTSIPLGQKYYGALSALRGTATSGWSAPSNPFGFENPTPRVPTATRLRK